MLVLTNELSVTGLATISGILRLNGANPILSCNNDIIWTPTALLHEITSGIFKCGRKLDSAGWG
ncbi:MAG: hypothetical protein LRZ88_07855 [Candidatus Cloacimonetes bacterium]|nr:hypothetical protein [Candidatus Cloacimonadota bacterium]